MKYLKTYKLFEKQLELFPQESDYKKTIDTFAKHFKAPKVQDTSLTTDQIIEKYRNNYNELYKNYLENSDNFEDMDYIAMQFLKNDDYKKIILKYLLEIYKTQEERQQYLTFANHIGYDIEKLSEDNYFENIIKNILSELDIYNYYSLYELKEDNIIEEDVDFSEWIFDNYMNEIDYESYTDSQYFYELINYLEDSEDNEYIKIYRMIDIPDNYDEFLNSIKKYDGVGNYWTYDFDKAEAYWTDNSIKMKNSIILIANVSVGNIDWNNTFEKSIYGLKDEREIKVKWDHTVNLEGIYVQNLYNKLHSIKKQELKNIKEIFKLKDTVFDQLSDLTFSEVEKKAYIYFDEPITVKT